MIRVKTGIRAEEVRLKSQHLLFQAVTRMGGE